MAEEVVVSATGTLRRRRYSTHDNQFSSAMNFWKQVDDTKGEHKAEVPVPAWKKNLKNKSPGIPQFEEKKDDENKLKVPPARAKPGKLGTLMSVFEEGQEEKEQPIVVKAPGRAPKEVDPATSKPASGKKPYKSKKDVDKKDDEKKQIVIGKAPGDAENKDAIISEKLLDNVVDKPVVKEVVQPGGDLQLEPAPKIDPQPVVVDLGSEVHNEPLPVPNEILVAPGPPSQQPGGIDVLLEAHDKEPVIVPVLVQENVSPEVSYVHHVVQEVPVIDLVAAPVVDPKEPVGVMVMEEKVIESSPPGEIMPEKWEPSPRSDKDEGPAIVQSQEFPDKVDLSRNFTEISEPVVEPDVIPPKDNSAHTSNASLDDGENLLDEEGPHIQERPAVVSSNVMEEKRLEFGANLSTAEIVARRSRNLRSKSVELPKPFEIIDEKEDEHTLEIRDDMSICSEGTHDFDLSFKSPSRLSAVDSSSEFMPIDLSSRTMIVDDLTGDELTALDKSSKSEISISVPVPVNTPAGQDKPIILSPLSPASGHKERLAKKERVHQEVLSTESTYVNSLRYLIDAFAHPLKSNPNLGLAQVDATILFSNVEIIAMLHGRLLADLQETPNVGKVILKMADFLRMYTEYLNQYEQSMEVFQRNRKNKKFQRFLKQQREDPASKGLDLCSYLIMPVQRIPRYELLLREMLRFSTPDDSDYADLQSAFEKIRDIALYINDRKRRLENANKLLEIQNKMDKEVRLVSRSRQFLKEGEMKKISKKKG